MISMEEAKANIGKPFKWTLSINWDIIRDVTDDGYVIGDYLTAPIEDVRLKQEQPEALKKYLKSKHENKTD